VDGRSPQGEHGSIGDLLGEGGEQASFFVMEVFGGTGPQLGGFDPFHGEGGETALGQQDIGPFEEAPGVGDGERADGCDEAQGGEREPASALAQPFADLVGGECVHDPGDMEECELGGGPGSCLEERQGAKGAGGSEGVHGGDEPSEHGGEAAHGATGGVQGECSEDDGEDDGDGAGGTGADGPFAGQERREEHRT
jgi:hypothetical protein